MKTGTIRPLAASVLLLFAAAASAEEAVATFAGGCFWCMEPPFDAIAGVQSTVSGYMGGHVENPTYRQVSAGGTGHAEVVQVTFDDDEVTYSELLDVYWRNVDPLDGDGQFCDRGDSYRPAIFHHTPAQERAARESKQALERSERFSRPLAVEIVPAGAFYAAEDYHQDYYEKNPLQYKFYRWRCGRDARLEEVWSTAGPGEVSSSATP